MVLAHLIDYVKQQSSICKIVLHVGWAILFFCFFFYFSFIRQHPQSPPKYRRKGVWKYYIPTTLSSSFSLFHTPIKTVIQKHYAWTKCHGVMTCMWLPTQWICANVCENASTLCHKIWHLKDTEGGRIKKRRCKKKPPKNWGNRDWDN